MIDEDERFMEQRLLHLFRYLLTSSIMGGSKAEKKAIYEGVSSQRFLLEELGDFVEKDGRIKQWVRARCLESVAASIGLDEYLRTLLIFRGSSPSRTAPLNLLFASNQISRALDPIVTRLLNELYSRKRLNLSEEKLDSLNAILNPSLDFTVSSSRVFFSVDELEQLRNNLLEIALERYDRFQLERAKSREEPQKLHPIGKVPELSLEKLIDVSKNYRNLTISLENGILRWQYGQEPPLFVKDGYCFFNQTELELRRTDYDIVKKQFNLMKKAVSRSTRMLAGQESP